MVNASSKNNGAGLPSAAGLYDPRWEHDACGVAFFVDIKGRASHEVVAQGLTALQNLRHRGASGYEKTTGDGAGILIQIPQRFNRHVCGELGIELPDPGHYGVGMLFMPQNPSQAEQCREVVAGQIAASGLELLGWRAVPQDNSEIGNAAKAGEPDVQQVFIGSGEQALSGLDLERKLYLLRRRIEKSGAPLYVASLSSRTLIYKGMLTAEQLPGYYPDLTNPAIESALALVHQRFSTNTFPTWSLAHPYRYLAHNGEINTLRGNINWMHAREQLLESEIFGDELADLLPVIQPGGSDSAALDNVLEFMLMTGRSLPHALMMLIPEPWQHHTTMGANEHAFYDFHSAIMEPWDGPAAVAFTDGELIGATLDRNGLRPGRYYVTSDDRVILASEVGVLDIAPEDVVYKGRLEPGKMLLIDTVQGRIIPDEEIKAEIAAAEPYADWLAQSRVHLNDIPAQPTPNAVVGAEFISARSSGTTTRDGHQGAAQDMISGDVGQSGGNVGGDADRANTRFAPTSDVPSLLQLQHAFGYTHEDLRLLVGPMAVKGEEPIGSMGNDTPLAVLSERSQLLFNYFKQLFAQVTNPPLDAIREELVTSMQTLVGPGGNFLAPGPDNARQVEIDSPILTNDELARLAGYDAPGFKAVELPMVFDVELGSGGLSLAMNLLCRQASKAVADGATMLILSDRGVDEAHAPIPSLMAVAGVHHHLVREGTRTKTALLVETGEAREVHHFALLLGYGASAINPYMVFDILDDLIANGSLTDISTEQGAQRFIKAANKGILKVMSKMGISTIDSYRGAQIFEAVGLNEAFIERHFTGTASRIGGVGIDVVAEEALMRHRRAYPQRNIPISILDWGGNYQWRRDGEHHALNPETIQKLQHATRQKRYDIYHEYTAEIDEHNRELATIRGLMDLKYAAEPVPIDEVEPVEAILHRFATGAMSFGSISKEAHETLAIAMNRIGGKSNSGEGGEDRARYIRDHNGDWRRSAVKQIASGRFGVTSEYLVNADELQIKMAQGAKPGEGGQLPGEKVNEVIARVRHSTPGVGLISPPPHHDIYSIEDLAQLIYDLKNGNPEARVSVKLVAEVGVGTVAAGVSKAHADVVLISGHDGGTGASPLTGMKHAGVPWELGLAETQQVLRMNNLRDRIVVQTDGQLKTGRDVVIAAMLGAEEYGFATAPLVVLGCVMMRVCHLNTCPVGIATQDPELRKRFAGRAEDVETFFRFIAQDVREHMAALGFRSMDEMIGRIDRLDARPAVEHYKARGLDLSKLLYEHPEASGSPPRRMQPQDHGLDGALDNQLIELSIPALDHQGEVCASLPIQNVHRTVGTMLGSEISRRYGADGLPDSTIQFDFTGSAGQSFGAFIPSGLTLTLEGDANDYVGKGLSGGRLVIHPPKGTALEGSESILLGNVALYGATSGEAFFAGRAGERFAVRNSGAHAVVEGVGDHGCEYMTGGRVVILGTTGRNFAAGMSGGVAYVHDPQARLEGLCNMAMVGLEPVSDPEDESLILDLLERHAEMTGSKRASGILDNWLQESRHFVKVMPHEYRRVLEAQQQEAEALAGVRYG